MTQVVQDAQQDFWQPPVALDGALETIVPAAASALPEACFRCQTEFMIGSRFCHTCGAHREPKSAEAALPFTVSTAYDFLAEKLSPIKSAAVSAYQQATFPAWLRYLHFHEIKNWIGLPTPSLITFLIGLLCVVGAISVGLFYKASNLAEFQAIQMWRIEWLLAATASFVAGILLKKPSSND